VHDTLGFVHEIGIIGKYNVSKYLERVWIFNRWITYSKIIPVYYEGQISSDNEDIKTGVI